MVRNGSNYTEMSLEAFRKTATFGDYEYVSDPKYLSEVIYDLPLIGAEILDVERLYFINKGYDSK